MKLIVMRAMVLLLVSFVWIGRAHAAVPQTLTHQGRLLDVSNVPIEGDLGFTFKIYAEATGGTPLWTEALTITLDDGYFSVQLGSKTAFPANLFDAGPLFLGITASSDPEMTPRQPIASVPFAIHAGISDSIAGSALRADSTDCTYVNGVHDCTCASNEVAISGGGCSGPLCNGSAGSALVESQWISARSWRVSCEDASGTRIQCAGVFVMCLRVAP
jgi:hypothetical protein